MAITREAAAQAYPSRPITVVVPFAAGSPSDTLVRILGENMRGTLSQPIVVENVTGASGSIAAGRVACAEADGHTLILGSWVTHVVNGAVYQLKYNVVDDFAPIAAGVFFKRETGTNHPFVTYRGGSLAMKDLVAGQFDLRIDVAANSLPQVAAGTIKAYAVTAKQRSAAAPTIPTVDEAGLPGLHVSIRLALWAPKATPKDAIGKLNAACGRRSGRRERAEAACQSGLRAPVARAADAGSARRPPESRDRALVAHHQGRRHQGGVGR